MGISWFVQPKSERLDLPGNQWIDVKQRLTYGEKKRADASLVKELRQDGRVTPDLEMVEMAQVMAYLIEWSLRTETGEPVRIDTEAKKRAALSNLDPEQFAVIRDAIDAHIARMDAARVAEKNDQAGGNAA